MKHSVHFKRKKAQAGSRSLLLSIGTDHWILAHLQSAANCGLPFAHWMRKLLIHCISFYQPVPISIFFFIWNPCAQRLSMPESCTRAWHHLLLNKIFEQQMGVRDLGCSHSRCQLNLNATKQANNLKWSWWSGCYSYRFPSKARIIKACLPTEGCNPASWARSASCIGLFSMLSGYLKGCLDSLTANMWKVKFNDSVELKRNSFITFSRLSSLATGWNSAWKLLTKASWFNLKQKVHYFSRYIVYWNAVQAKTWGWQQK